MELRSYGDSGPKVIVLHGGPGAPGSMAPVARGLADGFRILEPTQRRRGAEPLTVARHVADLDRLLQTQEKTGSKPALVGHSWGAMLALAYAAAHPESVRALVLIGCGTFDASSRARFQESLEQRMDAGVRWRFAQLAQEFPDPDERLRQMANLLLPLYSYDLISTDTETGLCDARGHDETWQDMLRLQAEGVYPAAFAAIRAPVTMLHGADDPHPGKMIRDSLRPFLPQLEYHEWERCGHYPWLERGAREDFFRVLRAWLLKAFASS